MLQKRALATEQALQTKVRETKKVSEDVLRYFGLLGNWPKWDSLSFRECVCQSHHQENDSMRRMTLNYRENGHKNNLSSQWDKSFFRS